MSVVTRIGLHLVRRGGSVTVFVPESEKVAYVVTAPLRSDHLFLDHLSPDQELILIGMHVIRQVSEPCAVRSFCVGCRVAVVVYDLKNEANWGIETVQVVRWVFYVAAISGPLNVDR